MTRCPNCGHELHEPKHVSIADPSLPEGQYRTETDYPLHDGRVLKLRLGRGRIVGREGGRMSERDDKGPRRRVEITLKLGADDWGEVARALHSIRMDVSMGRMQGSSVSGGYASGWIWEATEDETVTHESWAAALDEYLDNVDKEPTPEPTSDLTHRPGRAL